MIPSIKHLSNKNISQLFSITIFGLLISACGGSSDSDDPVAVEAPVWTNTAAQTLLINNCATSGCHSSTLAPDPRILSQTEYTAYGDTAGQDSPLDRVKGIGAIMPQSGALPDADIAVIEALFNGN